MKKSILLYVILFPVFFQIIVYYGFQSSYDYYNTWKTPTPWYYKGIYGYRILSREVVDAITALYNYLLMKDFPLKDYVNKKGTGYYHALFTFNTIMAVLVSLVVDKIFQNGKLFPQITQKMRLGIVLFLATISALSQYVITHYDNSAIFLFLLTAYVSMLYYKEPTKIKMLLLCVLVIISSLNRETACLNISFLAAMVIPKFSKNIKDYITPVKVLIFPILSFVVPYIVLRIILPQEQNDDYYLFESITLKYNLTGINQITGWLFGILVLHLIYFYSFSTANKKLINRFLFFSLPYIIMIFLVGILWEIRLFVPLFYGAILFTFLNLNKEEFSFNNNAQLKRNT